MNELSTKVNPLQAMTGNPALDKVLAIWNDKAQLETIKKIYAPKLTDGEFQTFVQMGMATGLNPFLREIWAIKYDGNAPAQIFIGRDGYRKIISRNQNFEGIIVESVCSNDTFDVDIINGVVKHIPNIKDRGKLIGGYGIVYMKGVRIPYYVFVPIEEYNTGRSVWKEKPATMIKKVAEAQVIRMADQTCSSTYAQDELPEGMHYDEPEKKSTKLNKDMNLGKKPRTIEGETVNQETGEINAPQEAPQNPPVEEATPPPAAAPMFTFEEIKVRIEAAQNKEALNEAASVVTDSGLPKDERDKLAEMYRAKLKALKEAGAA